ncbi:MAG TPA: hypothetical protein VFD29_07885 [Gillisia sp.]|nr:hypothetical protein [Gillisia sp.]
MSYNILSIPPFDRQLKRLAKKYPSLKSDFSASLDTLQTKPKQGTATISTISFRDLISQF